MKVAFLCSSFELGRDGVGDYVRQFAYALTHRGHECQVLALADRFAPSAGVTVDPRGHFEIVRIPCRQWRSDDIGLAERRLARFAPDWVSLQMVCYGFAERGLLWRTARRFARLRASPRRHMMFHELWIGAARESPAKDRLVGWLQRELLLKVTRVWSPTVVHTSNPFYRELLRRAEIVADELTVPSNIPCCATDHASARRLLMQRLESGIGSSGDALLAGVFGSVHPECSDTTWMDRLSALTSRLGRRLVIVQLGRLGAAGRRVIDALRAHAAGRIEFLELGELDVEEISTVLQGLDFGLATTPWPLIGKSGTVAAMLEHGLPVLVTREGGVLESGPTLPPPSHPQLWRFEEFCAALESGELKRVQPQPRSDIYESFLGALQRAS